MDKTRLYKQAYRILENSTPLRMDCGTLCDKACCKGNDDLGMYLFPGEEAMYEDTPSFLKIRETKISYSAAHNLKLAVCEGSCNRAFRPLSCRIFPFIPYIDSNNILSIVIDPRAENLCPIAQFIEREKFDLFFLRNIRNVFRVLLKDKDIGEYVRWLSDYIDDYKNVKNMF